MDDVVISMKGISKSYKKTEVLHGYNLDVERGHICGLIGPNGAGKTTIMKILAGLMFQSAGELSLFGSRDGLDDSRRRMSFMIEAPIINGYLTARENLSYIRYLRGYPDMGRIDEVLDIVGLGGVGKKPVKQFSLGMKQRLGIGMALLSKPEVMVLDEPVNGLDPEGIVDIRRIVKTLAEELNVAVLISSHLLSELAEFCTDFSIINHGRLIENFKAEELAERCRHRISLKTNDIERTTELLKSIPNLGELKVVNENEIYIYSHTDNPEIVSKAVTDGGLIITRLCVEGKSLEEYYLEKVGHVDD